MNRVVEVMRVSDRIISLKLKTEEVMLNVDCVFLTIWMLVRRERKKAG